MGIFEKCYLKDIPCAFSHKAEVEEGGTRPLATHIFYFEFTNHAPRYFCEEHYNKIDTFMNKLGTKRKGGKK